MCANDFVTIDPLTWKYGCAMRQCDSCPEFKTVLDAAILKKDIQYSQWTSKKTMYKKDGVDVEKDIFGLFSDTANLETVLELLSEQLQDLSPYFHSPCSVECPQGSVWKFGRKIGDNNKRLPDEQWNVNR